MTKKTIAAIILAACKGTRMKSATPKVLHPLAGKPMVAHVLDSVASLSPTKTVVVVGPGMDDVIAAVSPNPTVTQEKQLGTASAVQSTKEFVQGFGADTVLVLYGDTPLIKTETLSAMLQARAEGAALVVLGFTPAEPGSYGRLKLNADGGLEAIVEVQDASEAERAIGLCNSGVMAVDGAYLFDLIEKVGNNNAKGEFYLTDIVALARARKLACAVVEAPAAELMGWIAVLLWLRRKRCGRCNGEHRQWMRGRPCLILLAYGSATIRYSGQT